MLPPQALFLGSYPPRECGIATFTKDMVDAYDQTFGFASPVIAIDEPGAEMRRYDPRSSPGFASKTARVTRRQPSWSASIRSTSSTFSTNTGSSVASAASGLPIS